MRHAAALACPYLPFLAGARLCLVPSGLHGRLPAVTYLVWQDFSVCMSYGLVLSLPPARVGTKQALCLSRRLFAFQDFLTFSALTG